MWFWLGSMPYGARCSKYYGFNLANIFSAHYRSDGEIAVQIGRWLWFRK